MLAQRAQQTVEIESDYFLHSQDGQELCRIPHEVLASVRHMLTTLMYQTRLPKSISCLSALSGEGVTYTTLVLGATLASDTSAKVCVVELNWWSPGLQSMLRGVPQQVRSGLRKKTVYAAPPLAPSPGTAGVLFGKASLDEALIKTSQPNLHLLPAGDLPLNERVLAARSTQLAEFLAMLREQYDYVLLDLPAVSLTSDAIALASQSDAACVVVLHGVTHANVVKRALDDIKHLQILGVILNRVRIMTPKWIYNLLPQD